MKNIATLPPWMLFILCLSLSYQPSGLAGRTWQLFGVLFFAIWTYLVGEQLYNRLNNKGSLNLIRFKILLAFSTSFIVLYLLMFNGIFGASGQESQLAEWLFGIAGLVAFVAIVHNIYFLSSCISRLNGNNQGYGWYMLSFWFFPVGVWFIQPQIIELINNGLSKDPSS